MFSDHAVQERVKAGVLQARTWIDEAGGDLPPGNSDEASLWAPPDPSAPDADEDAGSGSSVVVSPFSRATVRRPPARHLTVHCVVVLSPCVL